ncbi:Protein of unknown function [Gryllus bimaculatus]|nr:Protein of unknown function [Gryllus bimaculatus]
MNSRLSGRRHVVGWGADVSPDMSQPSSGHFGATQERPALADTAPERTGASVSDSWPADPHPGPAIRAAPGEQRASQAPACFEK